jgi:hypothetical protein
MGIPLFGSRLLVYTHFVRKARIGVKQGLGLLNSHSISRHDYLPMFTFVVRCWTSNISLLHESHDDEWTVTKVLLVYEVISYIGTIVSEEPPLPIRGVEDKGRIFLRNVGIVPMYRITQRYIAEDTWFTPPSQGWFVRSSCSKICSLLNEDYSKTAANLWQSSQDKGTTYSHAITETQTNFLPAVFHYVR